MFLYVLIEKSTNEASKLLTIGWSSSSGWDLDCDIKKVRELPRVNGITRTDTQPNSHTFKGERFE